MTDKDTKSNAIKLPPIGMGGRFKLEKFKGTTLPNGEVIELAGSRKTVAEFDNIITNQGLNELGTRTIKGTSSVTYYCHVGSGNTAAAATDTGLQTFVASTNTYQSESTTAQVSASPYYISYAVTHRFGQGAAAGNLQEVGMGWAATGTVLFSRALILDGVGAPTSITVLSDEYLDVTYEFRIYPPMGDATGTATIGGVSYDYIARACIVNNITNTGWYVNRTGTGLSTTSTVYDGNIGTVLQDPSGSTSISNSGSSPSYSNNSLQGSSISTFGLNEGNLAGGVRSLKQFIGFGVWQIQFNATVGGATIPKDATKTMSFTITHSWARKTL